MILQDCAYPGPSPRIQKWSGGGSNREQKAREGGEHERGDFSPSRKGGLGGLPREIFLILSASMCVFNGVYAFGTGF